MQISGSLRKRRKRNLAKVTGLGTVTYDEENDYFDVGILFANFMQNEFCRRSSSSKPIRRNADTRIRISPSENPKSKWKRVTRNPNFHVIDIEKENEVHFLDNQGPKMPDPEPNDIDNELEKCPRHPTLQNRSHFLDPSTMSRLRQLLLLGMTSGSYPWIWNAKEYRIDKWSPLLEKLWYCQWYPWFIQTVCLACFQFYSFFNHISQSDGKEHRTLFMGTFSVAWYCACTYSTINLYYHMEETRQYINTLLKFNKENVDKYLIHLEGYKDGGRLVINGAIPSTIFQVFISVLFFVLMPFQHWFLFSYIYPKPWYWLIPGAIHQYTVYGHVIASYSLFTWLVTAHTNSINFWLTEMHQNNDSGYTRDTLREPKVALEKYRALQVLCAAFNECMAPLAMLMIKLIIASALIPCSYVIIRSMNHIFFDEFPQILSYPLGISDCATAGFTVLTMAAEMYDLSAGFTDSWSRTKHKDLRRLLMSFPCLNIRVRSFYVITVSTTITYFQTLFDFITDCIMTFP